MTSRFTAPYDRSLPVIMRFGASLIRPSVFPPPPPPPAEDLFFLIDDNRNRVYRGPDPTLLPQDRVEVVTLGSPGTYLVICGFLPHFRLDNMHGYVRVIG